MGKNHNPNHEAVTASPDSKINTTGLFHLAVVYIVWGTTFLAIRVAVREGSGFPSFTMAMMRSFFAGGILLLWGLVKGKRIRPSREELPVLIVSGLLMLTGGNGLVTWAEQRVDSGLAALIVASIPIWAALIEALLDRRTPTRRLSLSLISGFAGIGLLSAPSLQTGIRADTLAVVALLGASASWAAGSVLVSRRPVELSSQVSAGYQLLFGAAGFLILVISFREPKPTPVVEAWIAWGYLVVFGSLLGFTSYMRALNLLPSKVVFTYAFVNPVIAVILGVLILGEPVTLWTISGAVLVILGVVGVFRERYLVNEQHL
jgi:drug/metabolite transporter (DMT)-like permease